jgi:quercetin dioxygenase-like cupin family protein
MNHVVWDSLPLETLSEGVARRFVCGERITVAQFELKKGSLVPEHSHDNEQISYVLEGTLRFALDGRPLDVSAGEMLVIPPNVLHSAEALVDCRALDIFSPVRQDWINKDDAYLRGIGRK